MDLNKTKLKAIKSVPARKVPITKLKKRISLHLAKPDALAVGLRSGEEVNGLLNIILKPKNITWQSQNLIIRYWGRK